MTMTASSEAPPERGIWTDLPVLGICGWSGSGKTTLIEAVLPGLRAGGLSVAVVKHDAHGIDVDRPGKDSDRFFRAGADVLLQGPGEAFFRIHGEGGLSGALEPLVPRYDLVLVEGHKGTPLPKVWLTGPDGKAPPTEVSGIVETLSRDADRAGALTARLKKWLPEQWTKTPVSGCVLIGGASRRMGRPKHLIEKDGRTWLERSVELLRPLVERVVISGAGEVPESLADCLRLPDPPGATGPLAGLLAVTRWAPRSSWLVAACDMPDLSAGALAWLLECRQPGAWATLPRLAGADKVEPLLAHYDFRARGFLERLASRDDLRPQSLAGEDKVRTPSPPSELAPAWRNVNS